jgi:hypothetical protein
VEAVKVFLGVLGNDVLKIDLSSIDPRRLARGEWEEVVRIGVLLVRVAKGVGMLEADSFNIIDLKPDATSGQFVSEANFRPSISPIATASRTPSPPPPRAPRSNPAQSTTRVTGFASSPPLPSVEKMPNGGEKRNPRPPENESTPPSRTRKPSYMTYRPLASPPRPTQTQPTDISICSCAFEEDLTVSTVHCHCDIHGSDAGQSDPDITADNSRLNWRKKGAIPIDILTVSSSLTLINLSLTFFSARTRPKAKEPASTHVFKSIIKEYPCVDYLCWGFMSCASIQLPCGSSTPSTRLL